jgi:hypothetical protein
MAPHEMGKHVAIEPINQQCFFNLWSFNLSQFLRSLSVAPSPLLSALQIHARRHRLGPDVDLEQLAKDLPGLSGGWCAGRLAARPLHGCGLCSRVCVRVRVCACVCVCVCALVPVCSLAVLWCRRDLPPCCLSPSSSHPKPLPRSFVCLTLLSKVLPAFRFISLSPCCLFPSPPALPSPSHSNPTHTHTRPTIRRRAGQRAERGGPVGCEAGRAGDHPVGCVHSSGPSGAGGP